ncbi:MAG: immune inhibitor, partial [Pseudonocardiales bacterium]|nr:immune inhibitor [Pseudonocardiales bacterium]
TLALSAGAAPPDGSKSVGKKSVTADELPNRAEEKRRALREVALQRVLQGKAKVIERNGSKVVKVSEGRSPHNGAKASQETVDQYVELQREKSDKIFVVLAEFADQRHPSYPDQDTDPDTPGPTTFDGPLHNKIPAPDRTKDNSTVWQADYNPQHYRDLYFGTGAGVESVKTFYERQSSGRYSVDGQVSDWVKVPYNEARYGRSDGFPCGSNVCGNTWNLIKDALDQWVADQKSSGRTDAQIAADLQSYDQWDRYDYNGNGNFNEPDGYIDHFQIVHAGGDQADGDPQQGEDAIWSHRWKAFQGTGQGPEGNKDGGTQIGTTGLWVADYTIQPENGGLSVFAHEYGHDLGLPDHYDTAGGDNGVEWWNLMAQSRLNAAGEALGTRAGDLSAWDKLQLGWLDYETVVAGQNRTLQLGPHEYNTAKPQGAVVVLPKKNVTTELVPPATGTKSWWSGNGDDLDNSMSRQVTLPAGTSTLTFQANWDIEDCGSDPCDYAYVEVDDGTGYKAIPGSITKAAEGNGIDGTSTGWVPATFDLTAFAGKTVGLRFHYATDGAVGGKGFFADDIAVTAGTTTVFQSGAEATPEGWTLDGFEAIGASKTVAYDNFYIASHRSHVSYDKYLATGPYNFGFLNTKPDWVEHFSYEQGLLVSYWDTSQSDNNTSEHPGQGEVLPIDAHPQPIYNLDGRPWRSRIQVYDAPFSQEKAKSFTLHINGKPSYVRGQAAQPVFDDSNQYWYPEIPLTGVKVPNAGVRIKVLKTKGTSMDIRISSTR